MLDLLDTGFIGKYARNESKNLQCKVDALRFDIFFLKYHQKGVEVILMEIFE